LQIIRYTKQEPVLSSEDDIIINHNNNKEKMNYALHLKSFLNTPKVNFIFESLGYIIFLLIYSYFLLCELDFKNGFNISVSEYLSIAFIIKFLIEEIFQVFKINNY